MKSSHNQKRKRKVSMRSVIANVFVVAGMAAMGLSAWLISPSLGLFTVGIVFIALGIIIIRSQT